MIGRSVKIREKVEEIVERMVKMMPTERKKKKRRVMEMAAMTGKANAVDAWRTVEFWSISREERVTVSCRGCEESRGLNSKASLARMDA